MYGKFIFNNISVLHRLFSFLNNFIRPAALVDDLSKSHAQCKIKC